ncbi:hypothetical protein [Streptomyces sp. NPDC057623]|uniref:hypothetical protein n=1 Tax=Streptomyces sp. NPDC057623 TaxID=3346187 RepID=UPI003689FA0D
MRPGEHASDEPGGAEASAGQAGAQVAVAPTPAAPGTDTDGKASQSAGAVWDQPLPWATSQAEGEEQSSEEPASSRAESSVAEAGPPARAAAVREEGADEAKGEAAGDAEQGAGSAESGEAADNDSSVALWQAAAADQQRGAHAAPTPVGATGVAGHAVSKWLLGAAVAIGGLVAAAGAVKGMSSPPAATAKEKPEPILAPGQGLDEDGSPTPTSTPTAPEKKRAPAGAGKAAAVAAPAAAAAAQVPGTPTPTPTHTPEGASQQAGVKSSVAGQSSYVSVQTALKSPNDYWSQSSVTVTTTKKLSALKVVLHVAQTGGVANTGVWTSLGDKATVHTGKASDGGADYVVVLNEGITLDAGTYVFQFGYNHDKGARETVHDIWGVVTTAVGDSAEVYRNGRY